MYGERLLELLGVEEEEGGTGGDFGVAGGLLGVVGGDRTRWGEVSGV